jgi:hypothetical protein
MNWHKWVFVAFCTFSTFATISMIGKKREPLTHGVAIVTIIVNLLLVALVVTA